MGVRVIPSLPSRDSPLVIDDKINRERGTFKPNVDIKGGVDQQEFKGVYNSVVKVDV